MDVALRDRTTLNLLVSALSFYYLCSLFYNRKYEIDKYAGDVIWEESKPASFTVKSPKICGQIPRTMAFLPGLTLNNIMNLAK